MSRLQQNRIEVERLDQPGVSVVLEYPRDWDLYVAINDEKLTVAQVKQIVIERREEERLAARSEIEKAVAQAETDIAQMAAEDE